MWGFIPGVLPSTLRAVLRTFKIVPDNFIRESCLSEFAF